MGEKKFKIQHWHIVAVMLMVYDTIVVNFAYAVALWLRFDCRFSAIDIKYLEAWIAYIPVRTVITLTSSGSQVCTNEYGGSLASVNYCQ